MTYASPSDQQRIMKRQGKRSMWFLLGMTLLLASCQPRATTVPTRKTIEDAVFASGYIEQENNYTVSATVEGIIVALPIKEGDAVAAKDLIAVVENDVQTHNLEDARSVYEDARRNASPDAPPLRHLQAQVDQARQQLEHDKVNYRRYKDLREKNSVSQLEYERAELQYQASRNNLIALEKQYQDVQEDLALALERSRVQLETQRTLLSDYQLATEQAGQVIHVFKKQGELARRGEAIARIGSGAYIIVLFVSEEDITKVDIGQPVAVHLNTYPGDPFPARVTKIHPGFDEAEQSYVVEARFDQLPAKVFSGTQLQANIETGRRENVLVIPTDFVSRGSYVLLESGEERQIVTGSKNRAWIEVVFGISEHEVLVKPAN